MEPPEPAPLPPPSPRWWRLLPSPADAVLVAILGLLLALPVFDTDLWWHLATGERILAQGAVPRADIFSFTATGRPWVAHEWLAEVALAGLFRLGGLEAIAAVQAIALALVIALVYRRLEDDGVPFARRAALVLVALILVLPAAHPRPYLFTLIALAALQHFLRHPTVPRAAYAFVPLLFVLWANVHAGWAVGLAWLALVAGAEAWRRRRPPRDWFALLVAAAAAVVLNPNGADLLAYPLQYRSGSAHYGLIVEWASPDFHLPFNWLLAAWLAAMLAAALARRTEDWRRDLVLALGFGALALLSVRNIPFVAVVGAPIVGRVLVPGPGGRRSLFRGGGMAGRLAEKVGRVLSFDHRLRGLTWFSLAVVWVAVAPWRTPASPENWDPARSPRTAAQPFPYGAAAWLSEHPVDGPLLNDYSWGGYLIWALPGRPVFIDGRADVYGAEILTDYAALMAVEPGWRERLERYGVRHALLDPAAPLTEVLRDACGWTAVYTDAVSVLLSRPASGVCPRVPEPPGR